jgi:hypothetical protein
MLSHLPGVDTVSGMKKGSVMKVRRLVLALVALVVFAGSVVPAHAATRHHHKKHHHKKS